MEGSHSRRLHLTEPKDYNRFVLVDETQNKLECLILRIYSRYVVSFIML
jgi:hypothetical protein